MNDQLYALINAGIKVRLSRHDVTEMFEVENGEDISQFTTGGTLEIAVDNFYRRNVREGKVKELGK